MKQWHVYLLAFLGVLCVVGIFFAVQDQKIRLDETFVVGKESCDEKTNVCVTPLSISEDRHTAVLLVKNIDLNRTCVQDINNGNLVPLQFYDCQNGLDWNGEKGTGKGLVLE